MQNTKHITHRILIGGGKFLSTSKGNSIYTKRAATFVVAFVVALLAFMPVSAQEPKDTATVYVCTGSAAYAYHTHRDCPGLNRCTASIIKTTAKKARKEKRKFCGYCRKRTLPVHKNGEQVTKSEEIL